MDHRICWPLQFPFNYNAVYDSISNKQLSTIVITDMFSWLKRVVLNQLSDGNSRPIHGFLQSNSSIIDIKSYMSHLDMFDRFLAIKGFKVSSFKW